MCQQVLLAGRIEYGHGRSCNVSLYDSIDECSLTAIVDTSVVSLQGLQSAVNYTCYVAGHDAQSQPNYATPATLLNVRH